MYKIKNVDKGDRWCHDKIIKKGETIEVEEEIYNEMASLDKHIFEVEIKTKKTKGDK